LTIDNDKDGRIDQYGLGISSQLANYVYVIEAFGGKLIDDQGYATFATEAGMEGLQLLVNQYLNDKSAAQPSDVGTASSSEMFGQGKAAMVLDGNWLIAYLNGTFPDIDYGTAEVPTINGKRGTMLFTVGYVINKQSQNKQVAWELIDYLTGKEGMEKWVSTGFALPTRKSVAKLLSYGEDPLHGALVAGVGYGTPWQAGQNLPIIMNSFNNQFVSALLGEQTLSQAMLKAQETANKDIKANE
jgi:multiple sugar transport system substrate-binding protein